MSLCIAIKEKELIKGFKQGFLGVFGPLAAAADKYLFLASLEGWLDSWRHLFSKEKLFNVWAS